MIVTIQKHPISTVEEKRVFNNLKKLGSHGNVQLNANHRTHSDLLSLVEGMSRSRRRNLISSSLKPNVKSELCPIIALSLRFSPMEKQIRENIIAKDDSIRTKNKLLTIITWNVKQK